MIYFCGQLLALCMLGRDSVRLLALLICLAIHFGSVVPHSAPEVTTKTTQPKLLTCLTVSNRLCHGNYHNIEAVRSVSEFPPTSCSSDWIQFILIFYNVYRLKSKYMYVSHPLLIQQFYRNDCYTELIQKICIFWYRKSYEY